MSEEEIIKEVEFIQKWIEKIGLIKERKYIQGLLDLYEKEKEENRKLRNCHLTYEEMTGIDLLLEEE